MLTLTRKYTLNNPTITEACSILIARRYTSGQMDTHSSNASSPLPPSMVSASKPESEERVKKPQQQQQYFNEETRARLERLRQFQFHPTNIPDSPDFGTNQYISINEELKQQLKSVVSQFHAPIRYAFAYGSGVFRQNGYDTKKKPMLDFIFGVSHPGHWHALNMQQNPHHYSSVRMLGSSTVSMLQEKMGAGVYFNPYVEVNGMMIKYGVVSIDRLCKDLIDWETLYLAGRMHKPVKILRDDARVRLANQVNLTEAVRVALLTLPENFSDEELFERIAGISYTGDFRMIVGENPNKVRNIVHAQMSHFHRLYFGLLDDSPNVSALNNGRYQQNVNPRFRELMIRKLPSTLYKKLVDEHKLWALRNGVSIPEDNIELHQQIAMSPALNKNMQSSLQQIIAAPALTQTIKGVFTAGPVKTTRYALSKLIKWQQAK